MFIARRCTGDRSSTSVHARSDEPSHIYTMKQMNIQLAPIHICYLNPASYVNQLLSPFPGMWWSCRFVGDSCPCDHPIFSSKETALPPSRQHLNVSHLFSFSFKQPLCQRKKGRRLLKNCSCLLRAVCLCDQTPHP